MTPATLQHWLPRVATHLVNALTDSATAHAAGDIDAAREAADDARTLAKLAWHAISRTKPVRIATPARVQSGRNDIHIQLYKTPISEHLAMPPHRFRTLR